jgi:MtN3 and saliva related transmembrane protein
MLNRLCAVFAVFMPLTALPQVSMLYTTKDASGLSLLMWVLYSVGVVPFLLFGIVSKYWPLVVLNTLWLIVQGIMIVGILLYN